MNSSLENTNNVLPFSAADGLSDYTGNALDAVSNAENMRFQDAILPGVSRTFALTIPQLPRELCTVVTNAYLLCRIADTVEDEVALDREQKHVLSDMFASVVTGKVDPDYFARRCFPLLSNKTLEAERDLVRNTARIIRVMRGFNPRQQAAIERCVGIMCEGMAYFQHSVTTAGLADLEEMDHYCYCVAGVVGEMLTDLFCDYSPDIDIHRDELQQLAASFGQGLQMTNILKDIWDDRARGACWLPRDIFNRVNLQTIVPGSHNPAFEAGLACLIGVAHRHLQDALRYSLLIPANEAGIRKFCLWAIGLAIMTLRKTNRHRNFSDYHEVKITRRTVKLIVMATSMSVHLDPLLRGLFHLGELGLPVDTHQSAYPGERNLH